jgi:uncharacterized protein (DUF2336 family)
METSASLSTRETELSVEALMLLARSPAPADREKLLAALLAFHAETGDDTALGGQSPKAQGLLKDILLELVREAERDLRLRLADRLKSAPWAPHDLIVLLAGDEIEIARPVIAQSPLLSDDDLVRILVESTLEHKIEVARRPRLSAHVAEAIIQDHHPLVMAALAGNSTAEISVVQLSRMVEASRRMAALRSPLVRHPRLTGDLAKALYAWVGESLRASLETRFTLDSHALRHAVTQTVMGMDGESGPSGSPIAAEPAPEDAPARLISEEEERASEQQLILKMEASGQLRPGFLLRCLKDGKLSLFKAALARLGGFPLDQVSRAIDSGRADLLALACAAVGIDRSAFPTLLGLVEERSGRRTGVARALPGEITAAFSGPPESAARTFLERVHRL